MSPQEMLIEITALELQADMEEDFDNAAKAKRLRAKAKRIQAALDAVVESSTARFQQRIANGGAR